MDGHKLKKIREMMGKTQSEMAYNLSITPQAYSRMERGKTNIGTDRLEKIAESLELTVEDMYKFDEKKYTISGNTNKGELKENAMQFHLTINEGDKTISVLQKTIDNQQKEIEFLRTQMDNLTKLLNKLQSR
jgi:transcriptional regulator with XRE-family HTH domain